MGGNKGDSSDDSEGPMGDVNIHELVQLRRRFEGAMLAGDVAWWQMNVETGAVEFHENKAEMAGLDPGDFDRYEDFMDRVHPDDYEETMEAMRAHLEGRTDKYDTEYRFRTASNEYLWYRDVGGITHRTDDGQPLEVTGIVIDITERKERERELATLKERYQAFVEMSSDILSVVDENGVAKYESPAVERILGYEPEELVGEDNFTYIHPEDRERVQEMFTTMIEDPDVTAEAAEYRFKHADGHWVWLETAGINKTHTEIDGYVLTSRDITDRKEREQELRQERDRFQVAFDTVPEPAVHVVFEDDKPIVHRVNESFSDTFGYTQEEARGQSIDSLVVPENRQHEAADINRQAIEKSRVEEEIVRKTVESERPFLFTAKTMTMAEDDEQQSEGIATYVDLTEQKRREEELARQNERLDRFASVVSHDLRNPLTIAQGRLELAMEEYESQQLEEVAHALDRMETLIDDLLTLARQGHPIGETEAVDLANLVESCWGNVATSDATLEADLVKTVRADRSRLQQLLENLIRNAVEHAGDDVTVKVGELADGFYVADNGPGVPKEERDEIFEPGYSRAEGGTGFGLAIVQEITEAHGWEIGVTDSEIGGARFVITGVEVVE